MKRRAFLRGAAAAPVAAPLAAQQAVMQLSGVSAGLGSRGLNEAPMSSRALGPAKFFDFAKWWGKVGERQARDSARRVSALDADIACMALPLPTKIRMQQKRQFERELESRKEWFAQQIDRFSFVEWYG